MNQEKLHEQNILRKTQLSETENQIQFKLIFIKE